MAKIKAGRRRANRNYDIRRSALESRTQEFDKRSFFGIAGSAAEIEICLNKGDRFGGAPRKIVPKHGCDGIVWSEIASKGMQNENSLRASGLAAVREANPK